MAAVELGSIAPIPALFCIRTARPTSRDKAEAVMRLSFRLDIGQVLKGLRNDSRKGAPT